MNDQTAQDPQQVTNSYVDEYVPPKDGSSDNSSDPAITNVPVPEVSALENDDSADVLSDEDFKGSSDSNISDEDIEAQNIFFMLGVEQGDDELKEKFLDQLQEVIWDDFLTNDVELLLTGEELVEFKTHKQKADTTQGDAQESAKDEMVEYLEKLVPDLEDIMLEKALDLKADLFVERINGAKEFFAQNPEKLELVSKAEQLMFEDKWRSSAQALNSIEE